MRVDLIWNEGNRIQTRPWIVEAAVPAPRDVLSTDRLIDASEFLRRAESGDAFVWRGDFQIAKTLLIQARKSLGLKIENRKFQNPQDAFLNHRQMKAREAHVLARLLIPVEVDGVIQLLRAPDARTAIEQALGSLPESGFLVSLRELLGFIGASEWRKKGIDVPALGAKIYPYYGVFSPVRGEYLDLLNQVSIPASVSRAFDIGTGSGVIAAILAKRSVPRVLAIDSEPRAVACARENARRLGLGKQVEVVHGDVFPEGTADLIVCNPPWIPFAPSSPIERAVFDDDHQMLKRFLRGLGAHLAPSGQAWLILSDLAEHLGLRQKDELSNWISEAGFKISETFETRPRHPKASEKDDPLFFARTKELTRLMVLRRS